jgi:RNA polymerase sigma-70 factor (ECF subfamily)
MSGVEVFLGLHRPTWMLSKHSHAPVRQFNGAPKVRSIANGQTVQHVVESALDRNSILAYQLSRKRAMLEKPEPELIADCKRGDNAAMTELFDRHYASSLRLARGILRSEEESQDAVQSAYVSALRYLHSFRGDATFKTWITRIVMNHCLVRLHERRRRRDWVSLDDQCRNVGLTMLASATPTPEKSTLCQEIASALSDAAASLPKRLREVFALCAFSDLSLKEAAAALGLTVSATKTRLFRAHARMRSQLRPMWSDIRIHEYRVARQLHTEASRDSSRRTATKDSRTR